MGLFGDLSDIPELRNVEPAEYDLRVIKAQEVEAKNGRPGLMLVCEIVGEENTNNVFHKVWFPVSSDDEDKAQTMNRMNKEFLEALGLPVDGSVELEDFADLEFSVMLDLEEYDGTERNVVKKIT